MTAKRYVFPKDMEEWFDEMYPVTSNKAIAETLGCCESTVWKIGKRRGLKKTQEYLDRIRKRSIELATEANRKNTEKTRKFIEAGRKYRFPKGATNIERFGKDVDEIRKKRISESYQKIYNSEKARVAFGMDQKTKIRIGRQNPERARFKWYLRGRGYIVDDKTRTVYWNENTKRGSKVETRDQPWYTFKEQEVDNGHSL